MSSERQDDATSRGTGSSIWQNERVRRLVLSAAVLLVVFLLGFAPMWMTARDDTITRSRAATLLPPTGWLISTTLTVRRREARRRVDVPACGTDVSNPIRLSPLSSNGDS